MHAGINEDLLKMYSEINGRLFVEAIGRNPGEELQHSHLYFYDKNNGGLTPMCTYGWNRSDGEGYSILRGHTGARGTCKRCLKRARAGDAPLFNGAPHKTKWI